MIGAVAGTVVGLADTGLADAVAAEQPRTVTAARAAVEPARVKSLFVMAATVSAAGPRRIGDGPRPCPDQTLIRNQAGTPSVR